MLTNFMYTYYKLREKLAFRKLLIIYIICLCSIILILQKLINEKWKTPVAENIRTQYECNTQLSAKYMHEFFVTSYSTGPKCDLSKLKKPNYVGRDKSLPADNIMKPFEEQMSNDERKITLKLIKVFATLMSDHGLTSCYFMSGGTLLGSYRHHGFIPWDDDFDLSLDQNCKESVFVLLDKLSPQYQYVKQQSKFKFFTEFANSTDSSKKYSPYSWGWPYLDVIYTQSNSTHTSEIGSTYGRMFEYLNEDIYPLMYRPFENIWLPAPNNPLAYLVESYGSGKICNMFGYSHIKEGGGASGTVECQRLSKKYAFVKRKVAHYDDEIRRKEDGIVWVEETLVRKSLFGRDTIYHNLYIPMNKESAYSKTYALLPKNAP